MNNKIFDSRITENNYLEFIEQVMNIFRLSNYNKYILFSLKIENDECSIQLSVLNNEGNSQKYDVIKMDINNQYFYPFLRELVFRFHEQCVITNEDIVNLDGDSFVAYRMITEFNDLITIDGLTEEVAKEFLKPKKAPSVELNIHNNLGASNVFGFLLMIVSLIISIIAVIMIVD